eukprot:m.282448 g.282448  ORF g.282448 m.282448 type:complete len:344 (+) comp19849_c0_seq1:209-1240(+)
MGDNQLKNKPVWNAPGPKIKRAPLFAPACALADVKNALSEPPSGAFELRGKDYLRDKKKLQAKPPIFSVVEVRPFTRNKPIWHAGRCLKPLREFLDAHPDREFFIANRILPTNPVNHVISVFVRTVNGSEDAAFERVWQRYKDGDDKYKDLRLKYITKIPNAPFMVKTAVSALGGFRPVIMGKGYLDQKHFSGANYTEVDVDIGSSRIARGVVGIILPQAKKLIIDEAFLIEGQRADELPERMLGLTRCIRFDLAANETVVSEALIDAAAEKQVAEGVPEDFLKLHSNDSESNSRASSITMDLENLSLPPSNSVDVTPICSGGPASLSSDADDDDDFHDAEED